MAKEIILISNPRVLQIPIQENNDSLVDIRGYPQFTVDTRKSNSSDSYFKLRESIIDMLLEANKFLPDGIKFLIIEGYRPLSLQTRYFNNYLNKLKQTHPDWDDKKLYEEAGKYVAPPDIIPPHTTGGAVDLTLIDSTGKELGMGTEINESPEESLNKVYTDSPDISETAKTNRQILINAMTKAGFVNYPYEWWHWSYGDRYWAYITNQQFALFGSI